MGAEAHSGVCSGPQRRDRLPSDGRPRLKDEVRAMPTHVGVALIGTILFAISVIFRVWV
jgi:hypothetical protein